MSKGQEVGEVIVLVPDPNSTPTRITFSIVRFPTRYTHQVRSGDETSLNTAQCLVHSGPISAQY